MKGGEKIEVMIDTETDIETDIERFESYLHSFKNLFFFFMEEVIL